VDAMTRRFVLVSAMRRKRAPMNPKKKHPMAHANGGVRHGQLPYCFSKFAASR
jgi:hypothetical protein